MKKARFWVYEIEHGGDVDAALEDLKKAGAKDLAVLNVDSVHECMLVECELPESALDLKDFLDYLTRS